MYTYIHICLFVCVCTHTHSSSKAIFIDLGEWGEREKQTLIGFFSCAVTRNQTRSPGMCPDEESDP